MKKEEKKSAYVELLEKCGNQQILIAQLRTSGEEMGKEITHQRHVIAGQKGKIKQLTNEVDKWKRLEKEADEVCEKYAADKEYLKSIISEKDEVITDNDKIISGLLERNQKIMDEIIDVKKALKYYRTLPWYKRIFGF